MLLADFKAQIAKPPSQRSDVGVVPIEHFLGAIKRATGLSNEDLRRMDPSEIELCIPNLRWPDPCADSLYRWVGPHQRARAKKVIDRLLETQART
ncbi:Uncharacterised protein [uncultured archaeon]|nr:Uncharacterised protein [uncultured archaeon]